MVGIKIVTGVNSLSIDLGDVSTERKYARIKYSDIRSLTKSIDNTTVSVIFSSGEIYGFPYTIVDEVDGDTVITSQDILFDKLESKLFPIL